MMRTFLRTFKQQHRSCSTQSNIREHPDKTLLDYYSEIQKILTKKEALVHHLCNNVIFEDEHILAFNKPAGLAMKAEKTAENDGRIIHHVSLYQTLPELREHFHAPEMNLVLPLPRNESGVVMFGKNQKVITKLKNKLFRAFAERQLHQKFHLICVGHPVCPTEEIETIYLKQKDIDNRLMSVPLDKVSNNSRKRGETMFASFKMKVLSERSSRFNCSYIELLSNIDRWNCCEVFMVGKMSPILGDHMYSSRVTHLLGKLVPVDPELAEKRLQKLPDEMLLDLGLTDSVDVLSAIPLHLHRSSVDIVKFPNKKTELLTISADLPDYFKIALNSLKLDHT